MKKVLILLVLVGVVFAGWWGYKEYNYRYASVIEKSGVVKIYPNPTTDSIAKVLQQQGIISSAQELVDAAQKHTLGSVKAGNYRFEKGQTLRQVFVMLRGGHQSPVRLTFNNIRTLNQLAGVLAEQMMADSTEFLKAFDTKDKNFIGTFIPNTYEVYWTESPKELIKRMQREYEKFWSNTKRQQLAQKLGYTPQQIITIASIVDEETNVQDEMSDVAGVYINRLKRGMLLQADPTVKYAIGDFTLKRILNKHLTYNSPYNTYKYSGLPPGPICVPSIAAVDATLEYANNGHSYLYFCANADFSGRHAFANNLSQHNQNAQKYHHELNRRGIR